MILGRTAAQGFGTPPEQYDRDYMLTLIRALEATQQRLNGPRDVLVSTVTRTATPGWGGGLKPGQEWRDDNGFLREVQAQDVFATTASVRVSGGKVTVS